MQRSRNQIKVSPLLALFFQTAVFERTWLSRHIENYLLLRGLSFCFQLLSLVVLPVGIFSIINREDIDNLLLLIHNVEQPELAYSISPGFRGVPLKLLDVVAPEGFRLDLGIDKGVEFPSQESGVARRQLFEAFQELIGFEYAELRQIGLAWPSRRGGHS